MSQDRHLSAAELNAFVAGVYAALAEQAGQAIGQAAEMDVAVALERRIITGAIEAAREVSADKDLTLYAKGAAFWAGYETGIEEVETRIKDSWNALPTLNEAASPPEQGSAPKPAAEPHALSTSEQQALDRALVRSVRFVDEPAAEPAPEAQPAPADEDGRCTRCGLVFEDPAELTHECPAPFAEPAAQQASAERPLIERIIERVAVLALAGRITNMGITGEAMDELRALAAEPARDESREALIEALREIAFIGLDKAPAAGPIDAGCGWYRSRVYECIRIAHRALTSSPSQRAEGGAES